MVHRAKKLLEVYYFFPVRLFLETLRRNHTLLLVWLMLFLFITKSLGYRYGLHSLFLTPEYLGKVNGLSFMILGFTTGIFIMAFHMSSYITIAFQYPVTATFRKPFLRFSLNNFIIPVTFVIIYLVYSARYQHFEQLFPPGDVTVDLFSYLGGIALFYLFTFSYFNLMSRSLQRLLSLSQGTLGRWKLMQPLKRIAERDLRWKTDNAPADNRGPSKIRYYLHTPFRIRKAPATLAMTPEQAQTILNRNRTFALVFIFFLFVSILLTGIYVDRPAFAIPAAASLMLIFSLALFLYDLFYVLFKEYALWFFLTLAVLVYFMMSNGIIVRREGRVFGLHYTGRESQKVRLLPEQDTMERDRRAMLAVLERWKQRMRLQGEERPPFVVVNSCGGGLKAALWSYYALAFADSVMDHRLMPHVRLMTGASGGMVGAAYLRELYLRRQEGIAGTDSVTARFDDLSRDMLNPIILFLALKDWSFSFQQVEYEGETYRRDRGWALEHALNRNTGYILDKPLEEYRSPEKEARIPMMFLTPTSLNDGRQLLISPLPASYMCGETNVTSLPSTVELLRAYQPFGAGRIRFTSALRMNATYPLISPLVTLPGEPEVKVMDAGFRDNFGYLAAVRFLFVFRDWINENTGGVIVISLGIDKNLPEHTGKAGRYYNPFNNLYADFFNIQMLNGEVMLGNLSALFPAGFHVIPLNLNERSQRISLSWQLTGQEKKHIRESIRTPANRKALEDLFSLLRGNAAGRSGSSDEK